MVPLLILGLISATPALGSDFRILPEKISLEQNFSQAQLLVTATDGTGKSDDRSDDLTPTATFASSDPKVATVTSAGRVWAVGNGQAIVTVTVGGVSKPVEVQVAGVVPSPVISFDEHVQPIISKAGCNAGACHASQYGKGGLILSVFNFSPAADRTNIVRDRMQRRVNFNQPEESLFLKKPTLTVSHGGGRRLEPGSVDHKILAAWIACGAPEPKNDAPKVTKIVITPSRRVGAIGLRQQLQVLAHYSNGKSRDVTAWAKFDSMDETQVAVTPTGLLTAKSRGQAPVMVRFDGQAEISMVVIPYSAGVQLADWKDNNFVDQYAATKFRELGIAPSPLCDDATFLRRAFLDAIGTVPTVEESTAFLTSTDPDKRAKLVDQLLGFTGDPTHDIYNDQYTAFWTLRWADLLKNSSRALGERNMWALHNWLRDSFRTNKPFDAFATGLLTASGSPITNGAANYFVTTRDPVEMAESTAQLFLGIRLQCARCHHHPFEKYGQADSHGFAAFFSRIGTKSIQENGVQSIEYLVILRSTGEVNHPRTGAVLKPTPIDGEPLDDPFDRRIPLAKWLTSKQNDQFARSVINRYMGFLLGRGLVSPIDDMRATNPPSNPELMDALVKDFQASGFNLKHLMRQIMHSRLYQLSSQPTPENAFDSRFYSHFHVKRLAAEPLLDAIDYAAGTQTKYTNPNTGSSMPLGTRAIELPDVNYSDFFLTVFGKPKRVSVCECERVPDENLTQALHSLNGEILTAKISHAQGRVSALLAAKKSHDEIVTELYLVTLSRPPKPAELDLSRTFLAENSNPQECYQDLLWSLINSKQFMFVR